MDYICLKLVQQVHPSYFKRAGQIQLEATLSFDGTWSQRQQASYCFGAFLDCPQGKFEDFECASKVLAG
jgi:hypothetical protein